MTRTIRSRIAIGVAALAVTGVITTASAFGSASASAASSQPVTSTSQSSDTNHADQGVQKLIQPQHVSIDAGLSPKRSRLVLQRVRELYTFWDTGDVRFLHHAASPAFVDHTLPAGRPQGLAGIEQASRTFRTAVPDLRCTVADVLVSGNRVSVRQIYTGHFTGTYEGVRGRGQVVRFNAFDIQEVGRDQIVGDWHLEDNLTFLQQIGVK